MKIVIFPGIIRLCFALISFRGHDNTGFSAISELELDSGSYRTDSCFPFVFQSFQSELNSF